HVVRLAQEAGRGVVVVDDLSSGDRTRVDGATVCRLDVVEPAALTTLTDLMAAHAVTSVVHLAGRKQVAESMARPAWYYQQNVAGLATVLEAMQAADVRELVFSSSAAVYGDPAADVVDEEMPPVPVSPYGETKLVGEWLVRDAARAWGLRAVSLRYFNVAGAGWPDLGDPGVSNLVTMTLSRLTRGESPLVFGSDYPTPDGTCVRDFVHVMDLADAHLAALAYLRIDDRPFDVFNVGTGRGASVLQVIEGLASVTGLTTPPEHVGRRAGDPASFVASVARIAEVMGWSARAGLEEVLASAWEAWTSSPTTPATTPTPAPRGTDVGGVRLPS
ncbi:MAG: UDP-glucose 4-epimerase GalE, partial [Actinotalea sp.]|nr:UDP-glucose 4-epimerase GalE [Actinotalea sp.]